MEAYFGQDRRINDKILLALIHTGRGEPLNIKMGGGKTGGFNEK